MHLPPGCQGARSHRNGCCRRWGADAPGDMPGWVLALSVGAGPTLGAQGWMVCPVGAAPWGISRERGEKVTLPGILLYAIHFWGVFFGVTPGCTAGGSRSLHWISWALANVPSSFARGLPSFFPSRSATLRHRSSPAPLLPALHPPKALPMPTLPVNCQGLLRGYAGHPSPGGAKLSLNELGGGSGASAQRLQQAAKGVRRDAGWRRCWSGCWGRAAFSICTGVVHTQRGAQGGSVRARMALAMGHPCG